MLLIYLFVCMFFQKGGVGCIFDSILGAVNSPAILLLTEVNGLKKKKSFQMICRLLQACIHRNRWICMTGARTDEQGRIKSSLGPGAVSYCRAPTPL